MCVCQAESNRKYLMDRKALALLAPLLRNGDLVTQQNAARLLSRLTSIAFSLGLLRSSVNLTWDDSLPRSMNADFFFI